MTTAAALAPIDVFKAHDDPVNHIVFAREGHVMATGDTAMNVRVWRGREPVHSFDMRSVSEKVRPTERVRDFRFSSDSTKLFVAAGESVLALDLRYGGAEWGYVAPRLFAFLIVSPTSLDVSGSDALAAAFDNGTIVTWDPRGVRQSILRHNSAPRFVRFLPDDTIIGTDSFSLSLWRTDQRKPIWLRRSDDRIYGMAPSSDGKYVALRGLYTTKVIEIDGGSLAVEHKQGRGLPLVAFANGTHVLAIGAQHAIHLYDISRNTHTRLALDDAELISLAFLPDATQIVAGCSDGCIRTWENPLRQGALSVEP